MQEARPTRVEHMRPVGNYAYNIQFSDGHDSGIYTFDYLVELGEPIAEVCSGGCGSHCSQAKGNGN